MEDILREATKSTPKVFFSQSRNFLRLEGQSYPENAFAFYQPLLLWVKQYFSQNKASTRIEIQLNYLNTSSSKCLMDLIDLVEQAVEDAVPVQLVWYYEEDNERALELAEEFMEGVDLDYEIVGVQS